MPPGQLAAVKIFASSIGRQVLGPRFAGHRRPKHRPGSLLPIASPVAPAPIPAATIQPLATAIILAFLAMAVPAIRLTITVIARRLESTTAAPILAATPPATPQAASALISFPSWSTPRSASFSMPSFPMPSSTWHLQSSDRCSSPWSPPLSSLPWISWPSSSYRGHSLFAQSRWRRRSEWNRWRPTRPALGSSSLLGRGGQRLLLRRKGNGSRSVDLGGGGRGHLEYEANVSLFYTISCLSSIYCSYLIAFAKLHRFQYIDVFPFFINEKCYKNNGV